MLSQPSCLASDPRVAPWAANLGAFGILQALVALQGGQAEILGFQKFHFHQNLLVHTCSWP